MYAATDCPTQAHSGRPGCGQKSLRSAVRCRRGPSSDRGLVVLVHGAGSGPWVYEGLSDAFPGVTVVAVDLQSGLDAASHDAYAEIVIDMAAALPARSCCAGGLVVLQAADRVRPHTVVLLKPSAAA